MVDVGVGQPDGLELQAQPLHFPLDRFQIAAGVDDGGILVWSHHTSEQFCWKAVTGMVW
jgi:hypothetical protein